MYLPCSGIVNRQLICDSILNEVDAWLKRYHGYSVVIGGDFNVNMDFSDSLSSSIHDFVNRYRLLRCDDLFPSKKRPTYVNAALNHESFIDYIFVTPNCQVSYLCLTDYGINFSDHLPLLAVINYPTALSDKKNLKDCKDRKTTQLVKMGSS